MYLCVGCVCYTRIWVVIAVDHTGSFHVHIHPQCIHNKSSLIYMVYSPAERELPALFDGYKFHSGKEKKNERTSNRQPKYIRNMRQRETEDEAKQFDHARAASALPNYSNDMLSRSRPISEYFNRISLYIFFCFFVFTFVSSFAGFFAHSF